ncbi:MAG: PAS domain S-box protein [Methanocalculus sp.]|uniref:response regulator n=1 Tax=Methanocalculus sp. TaxID=2004547 RepID=UPI002724976A|nr:response regulator [Methanocalculus sp.]MDO9539456.1 PAS domain S-box protein [Methanocalculus sp.]
MITVLLVDDDESHLEVTRIFLERGGFSVTTANSGAFALSSLRSGSFDAVISDYEMPGMDGISFLAEIRSSGMRIPFIIFTGHGKEEVAIQALNEGADFYIRKGDDPKLLYKELADAVRRSVARRESERRMNTLLFGKATPIPDESMNPSRAIGALRDSLRRVAPEGELRQQNESLSVINDDIRSQTGCVRDQQTDDLVPEVHDQKQLLDLIFDNSPVNFYVYDRDCRFRYVSRKAALGIGMTHREMIGRHWRELGMPPELMEPIEDTIRRVFSSGEEMIAETSYPTPDGMGHFRYVLTPMSREGAVDLVLSTAITITEIRETEDMLREQDNLCNILFESAGDALLVYDGNVITSCNNRATELFGIPSERLIGLTAGSISPERQPDGALSRDRVRELLKRTQKGELTIFEWQGVRSDGTLLDLEVTLNQVRHGGRPVALAVIRDISNRKREERVLKEALMKEVSVRMDLSRKEAYLAELLRALPGMVYQCDNDPDWTMWFVSEGVYDLTGYRPLDLTGNRVVTYNDLILPEYRDLVRKGWERSLFRKEFFEEEYPIRRRDGAIRWVWERGYGVYNDDGSVLMLEGFITDVTDRRNAEESLRHVNEKLHLLSSITRHDVKNRIGTILGYLDLMEGPDPVVHPDEAALRMRDAVTRILRMIDFTKDYQELGSHGRCWLNIRLAAAKAVESVDFGDIRVDVDLPSVEILADPLFERVIGNCIENAVRHGEGLTSIRLSAEDQDGALIIICEDDGCGILDADKERIFDRGVGKNTGLGLFLAREILRISRMSITEEGVSGQGAKFVIRVPDELVRPGGLTSGEA